MEVPPALAEAARRRAVEENPNNLGGARGQPARYWRPGRTLAVRFLDGDPELWRRVQACALEWTEYANVNFAFEDRPDAELRVGFRPPTTWAYVGTDALVIPPHLPTMNFGWLTPASDDQQLRSAVLHLFGHALGLVHEHQNPAASVPWDRQSVYAYCAHLPEPWSQEEVDQHIFAHYAHDVSQFPAFDPRSIMLYPIPQAFTVGDFAIRFGHELSSSDKSYIAEIYPHGAGERGSVWTPPTSARPARPPVKAEPPATVTQSRRLEAAIPQTVVLHEQFMLLVRVALADSPPLDVEDFPERRRPEAVVTEEEMVDLQAPVDPRTGKPGAVRLAVRLVTEDFDIVGRSKYVISVPHGADSPLVKFELRSRHLGTSLVTVEVYDVTGQSDLYLGAAPLDTAVVEAGQAVAGLKVTALPVALRVERAVTDSPAERERQAPQSSRQATRRTELVMKLSGEQVREIHTVLLETYNPETLRMMARMHLNETLHNIAGGATFSQQVFALIEWAEDNGKVAQLVRAALAGNPDQPALKRLAERVERWLLPGALATTVDFDWVTIPAGEFLMGSDPARDHASLEDEFPQHTLYLPTFEIARVPVTVAQFAAFVAATGYQTTAEALGWVWSWRAGAYVRGDGANWRQPHGPYSNINSKLDHPVSCLSLADAQAFCQWAEVRLPTEAEWEKAARGADGRIYPWGDANPTRRFCNFAMNEGDTMPVGSYTAGASPYGVLDMAGNVYEWTASLFLAYPIEIEKTPEDADTFSRRVLRGGAFSSSQENMRAARRRDDELRIYNAYGLRVARDAQSATAS